MAIKMKTSRADCGKSSVRESRPGRWKTDQIPEGIPLAWSFCHDLRHPLTAILAYSELLAEQKLDSLQREDIHQEIRMAVVQMNDLISLLFESSRAPDADASRDQVADIVETIRRAIRLITVRHEFKRIDIRYEHEGLSAGLFDPGQLQQVITNVVLNACEAVSPSSGKVDVKSLGLPDKLEIAVSDNGPGIPEHIRHAVFQPLVSYGKQRGTGLGLAIVQKMLRDRGGNIYLDSTSPEGALFRIVLPYARSSRHESIASNSSRRLAMNAGHSGLYRSKKSSMRDPVRVP